MSYELVQSILQDYGVTRSAAEVHGIAAAMICVDEGVSYQRWFQTVFAEVGRIDEHQHQPLIALYDQTQRLLTQEQFEFDLFLPEDDLLYVLAEAISDWCTGFIDGIGCAGTEAQWSGQCNEILGDIIKLSNMSIDESEGEDMENGLMEINEYLRVAVQLIHAEIFEQKKYQSQ